MKILKSILILSTILGYSCSNVKTIETHTDGGTLKFKRRGLTKDKKEDKAMGEADENCKRNGFKTYQIENESEDGRFMLVKYKCVN